MIHFLLGVALTCVAMLLAFLAGLASAVLWFAFKCGWDAFNDD